MSTFTDASIPAHAGAMTRTLALAAAACVMAMFLTFFATGIGQDPLQYIHGAAAYTAILLKNPPVLRLAIGLDNLFIVFYGSMFLTLSIWLWHRAASRVLLVAAFGLLATTTLLDLLENMHFLTMISMAQQGLAISESRIAMQVWESLIKFHISYLGLFLLGFVIPRDTATARALCVALRWVQMPVGLLIYLTPQEIAFPLVLVRFMFFFLALLAIARVVAPRAGGSDGRA